jgi:hypothetical protein
MGKDESNGITMRDPNMRKAITGIISHRVFQVIGTVLLPAISVVLIKVRPVDAAYGGSDK